MSKQPTITRGRPSGVTRKKLSVSIPFGIADAATKKAFKNKESLSQFISRAVQNQLLNS